jgi:hypothetical protein
MPTVMAGTEFASNASEGALGLSGARSMATQIVMDLNGDSRHLFDPKDAEAIAKAEKRFRDLAEAGYIAAVRTATGESRRLKSFDPNAEETLFFPRLVGG